MCVCHTVSVHDYTIIHHLCLRSTRLHCDAVAMPAPAARHPLPHAAFPWPLEVQLLLLFGLAACLQDPTNSSAQATRINRPQTNHCSDHRPQTPRAGHEPVWFVPVSSTTLVLMLPLSCCEHSCFVHELVAGSHQSSYDTVSVS